MTEPKLKCCPRCKGTDLETDSVANGGSWIECNDCDYRLSAPVSEEALARRWNKSQPQQVAK